MSNAKPSNATKDLISNLCDEHQGVVPLGCPYLRAAGVFITIIIYNIIIVNFFDTVRSNPEVLFTNTHMLFEITLAFILGIVSILSTSLLMVPDMKGHKWLLAVPTTLSLVLLLWIGMSLYEEGHDHHHYPNGECFWDGMMYAGLPTLLLVALVRQGSSTHRTWLTFTATLSIISIAWISMRFVCPIDNPFHIFIDHIAPFALIGLILGIFSRRLFSW